MSQTIEAAGVTCAGRPVTVRAEPGGGVTLLIGGVPVVGVVPPAGRVPKRSDTGILVHPVRPGRTGLPAGEDGVFPDVMLYGADDSWQLAAEVPTRAHR